MENTNNNPVTEKAVVETSIVDTPVVEASKEKAPAVTVAEKTSVETPQPANEVVNTQESKPEQVQHLGAVNNGVMGTTSVAKPAPRSSEKVKAEDSEEKVAIYSTKNVNWEGVGKVYKGYNIVTAENAEKWLTRSHVRSATPEEVKKAFG